MARVAARAADLEAGVLPSLCAKTGQPTDGEIKIRFSSAPGWTWILLFFGIFPFLIAQYFATVHLDALLPMSDVAQRRAKTFHGLFVGFVAVGCATIVIGFLTDTDFVLVGLAMLVAAVFGMVLGQPFIVPSGQVSGEWVWLSFVHKRFARELDRMYGR